MPRLGKQQLISIVLPCYNEEAVFPLLRVALTDLACRLEPLYRVEIVFVDDGSRDTTWERIQEFASQDPRIKGVTLSRNFGHQLALTCGYDIAQGDAVICMDADLQDPPEIILDMVEKWREGADVVYAVRSHREGETRFKLWTASLFYRLISWLSATEVRESTGDFRLLSRRALDALNELREQHRFVRGMVGWIGYKTAEVRYSRRTRVAGETKYPFRKMLRLALDAVVSFSVSPLRLTFLFALIASLIVFGYLGIAAFHFFFHGADLVPGWTSLILSIMAFGALNLLCMGIMGEYIGRLYEESKNRPLYLIRADTSKR